MEIKKVLNKNIFKDKSFIKMVCFTVVLLLVLVLGSNFGYVSADEGGYEYCLNEDDYRTSSIYNASLDSRYERWYPKNNFSKDLLFYIQDLDFNSVSSVDSNFDYSRVTHYMFFYNGGVSVVCYLFYAEPTMFYNGNLRFDTQMPSGYTDDCVYVCDIPFTSFGSEFYGHYYQFNMSQATITEVSLNNDRWVGIGNGNSNYFPLYGNIKYFNVKEHWENDFSTIYDSFYNRNNEGVQNYWVNVNYFYGNAFPLIGFDNLENVLGGSLGGETPLNNLYAETADWWLNNDPTSQKFYNGSVTFNSSLNDYIIEHSDEYAINYDFECDIAFYYFFVPPSGQALNWQPTAACPFYKGIYGADIEDEVEDSAFEWHYFSCHFDFDNDITDDADDFISDGYGHRFSLYNDLYDNFDATGYLSDNTHITITPAEIIDLINGTFDGGGQLTIKQWSTFRIKCTAKIGAPSYINTSGSISDFISSASSATSGGYSETFDLLTGNSTLGDQSMLTNNNPYTELSDNTYDDTQLPSTGGTSGTTTVSTGNVTQTVNVTNEGAKYIPSLISKLIPTSIGDNTSGITERFYNLAQVNGFVTVMAETVPAVPNVIWTYCEDYLAITLYLLAVAFVLRLILDLL